MAIDYMYPTREILKVQVGFGIISGIERVAQCLINMQKGNVILNVYLSAS